MLPHAVGRWERVGGLAAARRARAPRAKRRAFLSFSLTHPPHPHQHPLLSSHDDDEDATHPSTTVTLLTSDGIVVLGASSSSSSVAPLTPRAVRAAAAARAAARPPLPSWEAGGLCIAAPFAVTAATTARCGRGRLVSLHGYTRDPEALPLDVAAAAADLKGGVVGAPTREAAAPGALAKGVRVRVALPSLQGAPPALDALISALVGSGHLVERVSKTWRFGGGADEWWWG